MNCPRVVFFNAVKKTFPYLVQLIRNHSIFILICYIFLISLSVLAHYFLETPSRNLLLSFLFPLCIQMIGLFFTGYIVFFIVPYVFQNTLNKLEGEKFLYLPKKFKDFFFQNSKLWSQEVCKALSLSYLFSFLLIIPGIIRFFRYSFVSHISLFNEDFRSKKMDSALKYSIRLTKGFIPWFMLLGCSWLFLSYLTEYGVQGLKQEPFSFFVVLSFCLEHALTVALSLFVGVVYHQIYLERDRGLVVVSEFYDEPPETFPQASFSL